MSRHLEDQEIAALLAGDALGDGADEHRAGCLLCRQRMREFEELLEGRRAGLAAGAPDWRAQRAAVLARIAEYPRLPLAPTGRRWLRPALAVAAAALLAVGLGLLWPAARPAATGELPVGDILAEAEALLASEEIPGFAVIDPGLDTLSSLGANGTS